MLSVTGTLHYYYHYCRKCYFYVKRLLLLTPLVFREDSSPGLKGNVEHLGSLE